MPYQMPGLHLKIWMYNTVGFPWIYLYLLYGGIVALWSESVGIQIGNFGSSHTGLDPYLFLLSISFSSTFDIIGNKLIGR
jgi:hypothetical protein